MAPKRLTDKVDNAIRDTKGTSSFNTATELYNRSSQLAIEGSTGLVRLVLGSVGLQLEIGKVPLGEVNKAGANVLADEVLGLDIRSLLGDLQLQFAAAEAEVHDSLAARAVRVAAGLFLRRNLTRKAAGSVKGSLAGIVLLDLVMACDAQVDLTLANKGGNIGGGQEDQSDGEVLDKRNIEAVFSPELNVGTFKEVESGLIQTTL